MLKAMCLMAKSSIYNKGGAPEGNKNALKKQPKNQPVNNPETTENNPETTPLEAETETGNKKLNLKQKRKRVVFCKQPLPHLLALPRKRKNMFLRGKLSN